MRFFESAGDPRPGVRAARPPRGRLSDASSPRHSQARPLLRLPEPERIQLRTQKHRLRQCTLLLRRYLPLDGPSRAEHDLDADKAAAQRRLSGRRPSAAGSGRAGGPPDRVPGRGRGAGQGAGPGAEPPACLPASVPLRPAPGGSSHAALPSLCALTTCTSTQTTKPVFSSRIFCILFCFLVTYA